MSETQPIKVHIRWMIRRDMDEVLEIERESFEFPWLEEEFIRCLRQRNCIGMVAEHAERVVGFMVYELHKRRLHLLNIAVVADCRRKSVGLQLIEKLIWKLTPGNHRLMVVEVRESNLAAQVFFRNCGLLATRVVRDFYDDSPEDAYVFEYRVGGPKHSVARVQK